jgi:hypothetical protein
MLPELDRGDRFQLTRLYPANRVQETSKAMRENAVICSVLTHLGCNMQDGIQAAQIGGNGQQDPDVEGHASHLQTSGKSTNQISGPLLQKQIQLDNVRASVGRTRSRASPLETIFRCLEPLLSELLFGFLKPLLLAPILSVCLEPSKQMLRSGQPQVRDLNDQSL